MSLRLTGFVLVVAGGLAACSPEMPDSPPASKATVSAETPSSAAPQAQATQGGATTGGNVLGAGSSLTGQVSGLTGQITGFSMHQTEAHTVVELASDVLFAFDSAELAPDAETALRRTAELAAGAARGQITVTGHTDSMGGDAYNLDLSKRRAEAVAQWLATSGKVPSVRLKSEGRGESEPVADNRRADGQDDPEGRARNRRVVVSIPRV